jgi:predicted transposase YdaD
MQIRPKDWANYVFPEMTYKTMRDMPSDFVNRLKEESLVDNIKWVDDAIVQYEPMGYRDECLPARMLRYRSDIWEYTKRIGLGYPKIYQAVIYLSKNCDIGVSELIDQGRLSYNFTVIRVWEIDSEEIIKGAHVGLYPLLPIMKWEKERNRENIIKSSVEVINTVGDPVCKADLLSAMSIVCGDEYSASILKKYIRREMLMASALFQEWVKDFEDEAEKKGEIIGEIKGEIKGEIIGKIKVVLNAVDDIEDDKLIKRLTGFSIPLIQKLSNAKNVDRAYGIYMYELFNEASKMINENYELEEVCEKTGLNKTVVEEIAKSDSIPRNGEVFESWKLRAWRKEGLQ